jgi:hypothetical protein
VAITNTATVQIRALEDAEVVMVEVELDDPRGSIPPAGRRQ